MSKDQGQEGTRGQEGARGKDGGGQGGQGGRGGKGGKGGLLNGAITAFVALTLVNVGGLYLATQTATETQNQIEDLRTCLKRDRENKPLIPACVAALGADR